jgi:hypothetical protein
MSRTVPYKHDRNCDGCGELGAFDFMGDYICNECFANLPDHDGCSSIDCDENCPGDKA